MSSRERTRSTRTLLSLPSRHTHTLQDPWKGLLHPIFSPACVVSESRDRCTLCRIRFAVRKESLRVLSLQTTFSVPAMVEGRLEFRL